MCSFIPEYVDAKKCYFLYGEKQDVDYATRATKHEDFEVLNL